MASNRRCRSAFPRTGRYEFDEDTDDEGALELAPVLLAPPAELAAAARACPLLVSAKRLTEWLGRSRRLTATGALRLADARAIITEFGLATSASDIGVAADAEAVEFVRRLELDQLQSARDFNPLERLWLIAQAAGLVEVDGRRARPGPLLEVLAPGSDYDRREQDAALLHAWSAAFLWLVHPDFPAPGGPLPGLLQGELLGMLTALYTAGEPIELSGLAEEAKSYLPGRLDWELTMSKGENPVENAVTALLGGPVAAGAVELTSGHVTLTPLGVWGVCQILRATGILAPAIGDYAGSDAGDLLTAIARYDAADGAAELAGWVQRREPAQAAADLAAAVKAGTPVQRMAGIDAFASLGSPGRDAARTLLGEPGVGALAAMWLASVGEDPQVEISAEDTLWVLVEMGAAMLDAMPPAEAVQLLAADTAPADLAAQIAHLWTIDHPRTVDVLTAFADHYQDRVVAKAARKAIFRARGRSAGNAVPRRRPPGKRPDRAGRQKPPSASTAADPEPPVAGPKAPADPGRGVAQVTRPRSRRPRSRRPRSRRPRSRRPRS